MRALVGTSGYNYDEWKGHFYPEKLAKSARLRFYAERFSTVEINYTFYRNPIAKTLAAWAADTPPAFRFSLKAWQGITHRKRLRDAGEAVDFFCKNARALGPKLGPILFGLPPFHRKDAPLLADFLAGLPPDLEAAFEFRHPSWFDDEIYRLLSDEDAALCVAESEELATPLVKTAPFGYFRLRRQDYDAAAVARWAELIHGAGFSGDVYVYFKHEDSARGVSLATELSARLAEPAAD
jgi:uncharacterized protein YecE (DUF72 family)